MESRHCVEKEDGSLQLNLYENVEIGVGHVCYIDDLTLSGTTPNIASNTRLFLLEWTPVGWNWVNQTATSYSPLDLNRYQQTNLTIAENPQPAGAALGYPQKYSVQLHDFLAHIYFDVDDTG